MAKSKMKIPEALHLGILNINDEKPIQQDHPKLGVISVFPAFGVYLIHSANSRYREL